MCFPMARSSDDSMQLPCTLPDGVSSWVANGSHAALHDTGRLAIEIDSIAERSP
jgi:hypothetical protein